MPIQVTRQTPSWTIRLEGRLTVAFAAELKQILVEWVTSGDCLDLDLEHVVEIDLVFLQLLCAAAREAARTNTGIVSHPSDTAMRAVREAGFDQISEFPFTT